MQRNGSSTDETRILWVEGRWTPNPDFVPSLRKKGFEVETVSTGKEALERVSDDEPDIVVVNAASMRTSGTRICKQLNQRTSGIPIMLISDPEWAVDKSEAHANSVLVLPFTSRKLMNRLKPLLPGEFGRIRKTGPIELDMGRKQVTCQGKKTKLTPRLVRLLKMLMKYRGEVVERERLFRKVWRTDYTGDTRTLDVHISWLRRAIEKDPRKPQLLKTIRGVGYRLDA